jgi:hypothetical protein
MNLFLSTATEQNRTSEPGRHDHEKSSRRSTLYYVMTSSEYCGGSLVFIVLLLIFIGILGYLYYRLRKKEGDRYIRTVRYAPVSQRESEDERGVFRKRPLLGSHGLAYDTAPRYTPSVSNTQTATVPVSPHMDITAGHLLLVRANKNHNTHTIHTVVTQEDVLTPYVTPSS